MGLNDSLFSYTMLSVALIAPIVSTLTYNSKVLMRWHKRDLSMDENIDFCFETLLLIIVIAGLILVAHWQNREAMLVTQVIEPSMKVQSLAGLIYNIVGSILIGVGVGLFKRIGHSRRQPAPHYVTVHMFF